MKFDLGKKKLTEIHTSSDSSMIDDRKKKSKKKTRKPAKKSRTKTRKPKFLSLSLQLSSQKVKLGQRSTDMPSNSSTNDHQQQLNLFPLHPENLVEDHHNMAYLFSAAADGGAASTLTGLLGSGTTSSSSVSPSASASLSYAYGSEVKEAVELVRTALRNKERDSSEERYVRYSEVVERRDEEVTSTAVDRNLMMVKVEKQRLLSLKLDYEEILNVWSDKGPLYVYAAAESPQTVPDIHDNFLPHGLSNGVSDHAAGWGGSQSHGGLWSVPELTKGNQKVHEEIKKEEEQEQEEWKVGRREASVQRYKEKRQNRLFSKTIRYQVRKLNAENRPRVKGRFVKRS